MALTANIELRLRILADDIKRRLQDKGINATGRTSEGFVVKSEVGKVSLVLSGDNVAPLATLEIGSRPHFVPIAPLTEWAFAKFHVEEKEARSIAYAVRTKIARDGTNRHNTHEDVYSTLVKEAAEDIKQMIVSDIRSGLTSEIKTARSHF